MKCPTPTKKAYKDRIAALFAMSQIKTRSPSHKEESRAYECTCGKWHLTAKKEGY